ncbi:MAG: response regulator [Betaproteobacteria bacterium]|nr:response regulator [Betaproteobacteria bacterium]
MSPPLSLLIVEDNENDALLLIDRFRRAGYEVSWHRVQTAEALLGALQERRWDVVLSDYQLPGFSGDAALELVKSHGQDIPFFLVSGIVDEETASAAMRAGAQDYLSKDRLDRLIPAVERELREARIRRERSTAIKEAHDRESRLGAITGNIPGMVFQLRREEESGNLNLEYASEGAYMLFGVPPGELVDDSMRLLFMILPEDRISFLETLEHGSRRLGTLNWEGRIRVPERDTKWINIRASSQRLSDGSTRWSGVMWNITHSKHTQAELSVSRSQLAELSNHLQRIKEEERERIARDIHDVLGGLLVGIKIELTLLASKLDSDASLAGRTKRIAAMVDDAISTSSRVARELRPGILKEFGLAAAIESYAEDFSQRTGIICEVLCADYDISSSEDTEVAIFRVFQEALTNVAKHAHAERVQIRLMQEGDEIVLQVADNGVGIRNTDFSKPRSFGVRGMQERVASLGGRLDIHARPKQGTELVLRAPLHAAIPAPASAD